MVIQSTSRIAGLLLMAAVLSGAVINAGTYGLWRILPLLGEFLRAFVTQARMNLHVHQLYGADAHHAWESVFKGLARALKVACRRDPRVQGVPSSKGVL